jgi:hypothetical protein
MNIVREGWLGLLAAAPLAASQTSHAQEPLGLSAVQRPFQSTDASTIRPGNRFTFVCPASDGAGATVYGTDVYTADSAVCAAAIHAGALTRGQAGVVTVVTGSGAERFEGSSRNGVTTRAYGPWDKSYTFARDGVPGMITWRTVWNGIPEDFVAPIRVVCPATRTAEGKLWGTDVYTRDSVVCVAAVHAGVITAAGGVVVVTRARSPVEFVGSSRNGVTSERYGPFRDAFGVTAAAAAPSAGRIAGSSDGAATAPLQVGAPSGTMTTAETVGPAGSAAAVAPVTDFTLGRVPTVARDGAAAAPPVDAAAGASPSSATPCAELLAMVADAFDELAARWLADTSNVVSSRESESERSALLDEQQRTLRELEADKQRALDSITRQCEQSSLSSEQVAALRQAVYATLQARYAVLAQRVAELAQESGNGPVVR